MAVSIAVACIYLWDAITRPSNSGGGARFRAGGFSLVFGVLNVCRHRGIEGPASGNRSRQSKCR